MVTQRSRRVRKELRPRPHLLRSEGAMARTTGIAGCAQNLGLGDNRKDVWTWIQIRIQTPAWQLGRWITLGQPLLFSDPWFLHLYMGEVTIEEKIEGECIQVQSAGS